MWMDCQQKIKVPQRLTLFMRTVAIPILQSHNHPRVCELLSCFDDIDAQILKLLHDHDVDAAKELLSIVKDQDRIARVHSAIAAASRIKFVDVDWGALEQACQQTSLDTETLQFNCLLAELHGRSISLHVEYVPSDPIAAQFRKQAMDYFKLSELELAILNITQGIKMLKKRQSSSLLALRTSIDLIQTFHEASAYYFQCSDINMSRSLLASALKLAEDLHSKHFIDAIQQSIDYVESTKSGKPLMPEGLFALHPIANDSPSDVTIELVVRLFRDSNGSIDTEALREIHAADMSHALEKRARLIRSYLKGSMNFTIIAGLIELDRRPVYRKSPCVDDLPNDPSDTFFHIKQNPTFDAWCKVITALGKHFLSISNAVFVSIDTQQIYCLTGSIFFIQSINYCLLSDLESLIEDSKKTMIFGQEALKASAFQDSIPEFKLDTPQRVTRIQVDSEDDHESKRRQWWTDRRALDRKLARLLADLEENWFGAFLHVIFPTQIGHEPLNDLSVMYDLFGTKHALIDILCPGRLLPLKQLTKITHVLNYFCKTNFEVSEFRRRLLKCLGIQPDSRITVQSTELENVFDDSQKSAVRERNTSRHVVLCLDRKAQFIPWESIPSLRDTPCVRLPFLHTTSPAQRTISRLESAFYILNPSGDLIATQQRLSPRLSSFAIGLTQTPPSSSQIISALNFHSLYLYFGHAGGEMYCRPAEISSSESDNLAITWLMGCSSGKLRYWNAEVLDIEGMVLALLKAHRYTSLIIIFV